MYLKNDQISATIAGLTMRSYKAGYTKEYILDPTAVTGWTDGTNVRRDATVRMNAHGDFPEKAKMSARLISFSGTAVATTSTKLQEMRDVFVGLLADGSYDTLAVTAKGTTRYATVGLEGSTSWIQQADTFASFKIDFYAPDPFIYGPERVTNIGSSQATSGGGLSYILTYPLNYRTDQSLNAGDVVYNKGNVDAWPVFKISGSYPEGFTIADNQDHFVTYEGAVTPSAPVTIDMGRGVALQGGIDRSTLLSRREWFSVSSKETIRPTFEPLKSGTGWCDIIVRDTWI